MTSRAKDMPLDLFLVNIRSYICCSSRIAVLMGDFMRLCLCFRSTGKTVSSKYVMLPKEPNYSFTVVLSFLTSH